MSSNKSAFLPYSVGLLWSYCLQNKIISDNFILKDLVFNIDNLDYYIERFVDIEVGNLIDCIECSAYEVLDIYLNDDCYYEVDCLIDPCSVAVPCEVNTPVICLSNYCGGCYADFYDLDGNLIDCYSEEVEPCEDINGLDFGWCDMFLGYAVVNDECQGVSGCGWELNGIDYSNAFFNSYSECENNCFNEPYLCEEIEFEYDSLFNEMSFGCEYDNDCISVWGDCDSGLGGCHYAVNESEYDQEDVNYLVDLWLNQDCMQWVCDCSGLPSTVCLENECELAYCYGLNPAGCFQMGCEEGYICINNPNDCIPSFCSCDGFYDDWQCTEDCGGGTCVLNQLLGDINFDTLINILDIILIIDFILEEEEPSELEFIISDINQDNVINVIDIIEIVSLILN